MKSKQKHTERQKFVYNVEEAAAQLGVSETQIKDLIDEGKIHAIDVGGGGQRKFWRIPVEALERFKKQRSSMNG